MIRLGSFNPIHEIKWLMHGCLAKNGLINIHRRFENITPVGDICIFIDKHKPGQCGSGYHVIIFCGEQMLFGYTFF